MGKGKKRGKKGEKKGGAPEGVTGVSLTPGIGKQGNRETGKRVHRGYLKTGFWK